VIAAILLVTTVQAASLGNPFNIAGTGTVTGNSGGGGTSYLNWTDENIRGSHFEPASSTEYPTREERWETKQPIGSFLFDATDRCFGGDILVDITGNGSYELLTRFVMDSCDSSKLVDVSADPRSAGVYGVKVVINNACGENHFQIGEMAMFTFPLTNLALGATTVASGGSGGHSGSGSSIGSLTDMDLNTRWRADNNDEVNWIGFTMPDEQTIDVRGIRVSSGSRDHGGYGWHNYAVQVTYDGDEWEFLLDAAGDIFLANANPNTSVNWVDFGQTLTGVRGIRIYGSDELGNNPVNLSNPDGGWIVEEILAYGAPIPEPATMSLLVLGGLALWRRR